MSYAKTWKKEKHIMLSDISTFPLQKTFFNHFYFSIKFDISSRQINLGNTSSFDKYSSRTTIYDSTTGNGDIAGYGACVWFFSSAFALKYKLNVVCPVKNYVLKNKKHVRYFIRSVLRKYP